MSFVLPTLRSPKTWPRNSILRERDERLESLNSLVSRMTHDFNNCLVPLLGYVSLIREEVSDVSAAAQYAATLETASRRTEGFLESIQMAVRPQRRFAPRLLRLDELLRAPTAAWEAGMPEPGRISIVLSLAEVELFVDEFLWSAVFQQLLSNARFALALGGKLEITLEWIEIREEEALDLNIPPGKTARLTFRDNGLGMSEATLRRACEPFFTTRTGQKCLGLGLTLAHSVAQTHGGQILLESREDAGSKVTIWIPDTKPPSSADVLMNPAARLPSEKRSRGKRILLVEDDALVREVIKSHLQRFQLDVLTACDGEEGLKLFKKHAVDIALVVTDITMPGLDGIEMFKAIVRHSPAAKVIMVTGDMDPKREESLAELGLQKPPVVRKPFNFQTFASTVQSQLG